MARKYAHPEQLFDYLRGDLDEQSIRQVDEHLSSCADCRSVVDLTRALKDWSQMSAAQLESLKTHPDVSELAAFFYGKSTRSTTETAAHVAVCRSCATELAAYSNAERAAARHVPSSALSEAFPVAAREMIRDWEESSFAQQKQTDYSISKELIARLTRLLAEREDLRGNERDAIAGKESRTERHSLVPVIVVDRSGTLRRVEMFEKGTDSRGAEILKYRGEPERFDRKPFHVLLDFGDNNRVVVSDLILRDEIRLPRVERADSEPRAADFFIVED